jgi:reactive intermediate/imine deaminase
VGTIVIGLFACAAFLRWHARAQKPQGGPPRVRRDRSAKAEGRPVVEYLNRRTGSSAPFSDAVRVGDFLILSGKIGTDRSGKLAPGGIRAETKQTMENIRRTLEAYGSSLDDVFKCTVMLADMKEWLRMNEVYRTYFKKGRLPARSALGANGLALGARVEIECWAVVRNRPARRVGSPAAERPPAPLIPPPAEPSPEDRIVTTRHEVAVAGRVLKYTARAGRLPILDDETGDVHGRMFFTAYTREPGPKPIPRPLTFLWNGGPGASSSLVHLLGFGPRRLRPDGTAVDNPDTWLDQTDLVFVDPVGTGYSRVTRAEYGPEFYQTRGDAESVAEFIRVYRNRFQAWGAPVFLAGESYGVTRAAHVADILQRRGITVRGVVLIGLPLPLGQLSGELRTALTLPTYTAAAFAHRKLAPDLQKDLRATLRQAERWAETEYAAALARRDTLGAARRRAVLAGLARFTGLDSGRLDAKTLHVRMGEFARQLVADRQQVVGRYDSRLAGPLPPAGQPYDPTQDPSLKDIINEVGVLRYFRNELGYKSDLVYQGPFGGGYPPPKSFRGDWMSVRWGWERGPADAHRSGAGRRGEAGSGGAAPPQPLRRALTANPRLHVLVATGYYDLVCPYHENAYRASHLDANIAGNVRARAYAGGHAVYTTEDARQELKRDVARFIQKAAAPTTPQRRRPSPQK